MGKNKNWFIESTVEAGEVVINDGGSSVDFRIEGDTDANLLVTDGSADKVGIGTNSPDTKLEVSSDNVGELFTISNHNVSASMPAEMILQKSRGSKLSPATMGDSDEIGQISWKGYDGSNYDELAYIKVDSASVSGDTSKMTLHSDSFVLDTGTLQFGTGGAVSSIKTSGSVAGLTGSDYEEQLVTVAAVAASLSYASLGTLSWTSKDTDNILRATDNGNGGGNALIWSSATKVSIGADTVGAQSEIFKVTGATTIIGGAVTIGANGTGHDVIFYSDTSNAAFTWNDVVDDTHGGTAGGLHLGVDDTGVDFVAHGATANKRLWWDQSADKLFAYGHAHLGYLTGDVLTVKGTLTTAAVDEPILVKAISSSQNEDVFRVYDKDGNLDFNVSETGAVEINSSIVLSDTATGIYQGQMVLQSLSNQTTLNIDNGAAGSQVFNLKRSATSLFNIDASNNFNFIGLTGTHKYSNEAKFKTAVFKINDASDSASAGELQVAKLTTSSGNLNLDSAGGTVAVADNLSVTGDLTVDGSTNFSDTTSTSFHIASGGSNLGWKAIDMADASSTPLNNVAKWIHPVDSTGGKNTAGIATRYIASDSSMFITTKDEADIITIAPGYDIDGGTVYIGRSASKQADLLVTGNTTVTGNLTVSGSFSGTMASSGTTSSSFQIDSDTTGPKLVDVTGDSNTLGIYTDGDAAAPINTTGIQTTTNYDSSGQIDIKAYGAAIVMTPYSQGSSHATKKVNIVGAVTVNGDSSTSNNSQIWNALRLGNFGHTATYTASSQTLANNDVRIYQDAGFMTFDSSADQISVVGSDLYFGSDGTQNDYTHKVYFYGNDSSDYMQWNGPDSQLKIHHNHGVGNTTLLVDRGDIVFGTVSQNYSDVTMHGSSSTMFKADASTDVVTFGGGIMNTPIIQTAATVTLSDIDSGKVIWLDMESNDITVTLPNAASATSEKCYYEFKVIRNNSTENNFVLVSGGGQFRGGVSWSHIDGGTPASFSTYDAATTITFDDAEVGSHYAVVCKSSKWYISGLHSSDDTPTV